MNILQLLDRRPDVPLKLRLMAVQGGLCWICHKPICLEKGCMNYATRDHIQPVKHGGTAQSNILLAHFACNVARQAPKLMEKRRTYMEWALSRVRRAAPTVSDE